MAPHPRAGRSLLELPAALVLAVLSLYALARHLAGDGGLSLLSDGEVLVTIDHRTGAIEASDRPGVHTFVPWLQEVRRLDRRPVRVVLGKGEGEADRVAPDLIVRGHDGSTYSFPRIELLVSIDPEQAGTALVDHGATRSSIAELAEEYARPILRSALGRATPREIVLPGVKQEATEAARTALAEVLARHGLGLSELSVSKPRFPEEYQKLIERRLVADQDTARLIRERAELEASRQAALDDLTAKKERERRDLERSLADSIEDARRGAQRARLDAEREVAQARAAAETERDGAVARAEVLSERYRAEAAAFTAELAELEQQGELAVRAALVERLGSIQFEIAPTPRSEEPGARRTSHVPRSTDGECYGGLR